MKKEARIYVNEEKTTVTVVFPERDFFKNNSRLKYCQELALKYDMYYVSYKNGKNFVVIFRGKDFGICEKYLKELFRN